VVTLLAHGFDLPAWCSVALALQFGKAVPYYAVVRAMGARADGGEIACASFRSVGGVGCGLLSLMLAASFGAPLLYPIPLWILRALCWGFAWQSTRRTVHGTVRIIALGVTANVVIDFLCWAFVGFAPGFGVWSR